MTQSFVTFRWFVATMVVCLLVSVSSGVEFAGGTGEPNDPYQIATAEQLISIGSDPNLLDKCFLLVNDIDLDPNLPGGQVFDKAVIAPRPWTRSTMQTVFSGIFDGNDHTISNLTIQGEGEYHLGLFGELSGEVKNVRLVDVDISSSRSYIGALTGYNAGTVIQCSSSGEVTGTSYVGGLVGSNSGSVAQCDTDVEVTGNERVGGLVGYNTGDVAGSHSNGSVAGSWHVGGLVGENTGDIAGSDSSGSVSGTSYVGGLVGYNERDIVGSHSSSVVEATQYSVGGLVGTNGGSVIASYSTGAVTGASYVGGFVGLNCADSYFDDRMYWSTACVAESYSTGAVTGVGLVGGFVGYNLGNIADSYSTGQLGRTGEGETVGGFAAVNGCLVVSCFWDVENSGVAASDGGTGKTTAQMRDIGTFLAARWDFAGETANGACDYWQISSGEYPQLCYDGCSDSVCCSDPLAPEGSGTASDPYLIRDVRDLSIVWFQPKAYYRLEASIDLSGVTWSTAVIPSFAGTFDGNGYVISDLHIQGDRYLGLFGELESSAVVFNLGLEAVDVGGTGDCVGGLVGYNRGDILSCHCVGSVVAAWQRVGGLVGWNEGVITASYSAGAVAGTGEYVVASAGYDEITIAARRGLTPAGSYIGGLVGENDGSIASSYSNSAISGTGRGIGGLVGYNWGTVLASYSSGAVGGGGYMVGGLVGWKSWGDVTASFWDIETSGQTESDGGTGLTTAEMQTAATFLDAGWDFESTWTICEGVDYPRLQWENVECEDGL